MIVGEATIKIRSDPSAFGADMQRGIGQAADRTERDLSRRFTSVGKKATIALTVPIVGGLLAAGKAAAEENRAVRALDTTLRRAAGATEVQVRASERYVTTLQNATGIADDQLRPALGRLVSSTRDVTEAQRLLAIATDVSVARSVSLEAVATALGRASQGQVAGLSRLGIATKDASGETKSFDEILRDLEKTFGGVAKEAADPLAKMQVRLADVVEEVGTAVIPAMEKLGGVAVFVGEAFSGLGDGAQTMVVIGGVALAAVGPILTLAGNVGRLKTALEGAGAAGRLAGTGLRAVGFAGAVVGGVLALREALDALDGALDRARRGAPKITELTESLAKLGKVGAPEGIDEALKLGRTSVAALDEQLDKLDRNEKNRGSIAERLIRGGPFRLGDAAQPIAVVRKQLDDVDKSLATIAATAPKTAESLIQALANRFDVSVATVRRGLDDTTKALGENRAATAVAGAAAAEGAEGFDDLGESADEAVSPFDRLTDAVDRVRTAIDNAISPTIDAQEASDRFQGAVHAVKEQLDEMRGATDTTGESQRQLRDALRDAERAAIAEVEALVRTGQIAPQAVPQALFDRINGLKQLFPGLSGEIDAVLTRLGNLSQLRFDNIEALRSAYFAPLNERFGARRRPPGRQHGGPVLPGTVYQVGEAGPELAVFPKAGQILPNDLSTQILRALQASRPGNSYTFSGAWPMDPRHFARAVVREQNWALR